MNETISHISIQAISPHAEYVKIVLTYLVGRLSTEPIILNILNRCRPDVITIKPVPSARSRHRRSNKSATFRHRMLFY
jgi:hypothetical protein